MTKPSPTPQTAHVRELLRKEPNSYEALYAVFKELVPALCDTIELQTIVIDNLKESRKVLQETAKTQAKIIDRLQPSFTATLTGKKKPDN